jgi:lysophospholipase L1-like esterase
LALGDSLAAGVGVDRDNESRDGYVGLFNEWFMDTRDGPHVLVNLARRGPPATGPQGETSSSFIHGKDEEDEGQLTAAIEAIEEIGSDVQVVTLDIGGNDLLSLIRPGGACSIDPTSPSCQVALRDTLDEFGQNYQEILDSLITALSHDAGVESFLVMTYYNPFGGTGSVFEGPVDGALLGADQEIDCVALDDPSRVGDVGMNDLIACSAARFAPRGVRVVDLYPLFGDRGLELTHIAVGDIHPNPQGHRLIADALTAAAECGTTEPAGQSVAGPWYAPGLCGIRDYR